MTRANKNASYSITTAPEGPPVETDYLQCVHCEMHYPVRPGSGRTRGFCMMCYKPTCGATQCDPCIPFEKRMEIWEAKGTITFPVERMIEEGLGRRRLWAQLDRVWRKK